jgi:hypothetical protein
MRSVRRADKLTTIMYRYSRNLGASNSWNSQGLSRPVIGLPCVILLTCICLRSHLYRMTLEISRDECNTDVRPGTLTATDTCIGYHMTRFEASRKVILHTRYVSTCVGAGCGRGRGTKIKTKANRCGACYYSIVIFNV